MNMFIERIHRRNPSSGRSGRSFRRFCKPGFLFIFILAFAPESFSQNIHRLVSDGDIESVKSLLDENPLLVNEMDAYQRTPIFRAVSMRHPEMVQLLIDRGGLVRVGDGNLRAPIHFAGFVNDTSMVALLLRNGAVIDTRAIGAATPLIHSSYANRYEMSRFLIEHGADINIQCNSLTTPLYFAALNDNLEYLEYLLEAGADLDTPDFLDRTSLAIAVRDGHAEIVRTLIDRGADMHWEGHFPGMGLLHLAAAQGHNEVIEILIYAGMHVNQKDGEGCTPLDYANRYGHESTADLLEAKNAKAKIFRELNTADTSLNGTIEKGEANIIKLQNGSWGIRSQNHFLIFGYSEIGDPPPDRSILNGYLTGSEMTDISWYYFDLGFHPPRANFALQGGTPVYSMQDRVGRLSFVLNEMFRRNYDGLNLESVHYIQTEQTLDIDDLKVTVVPSYQNLKGYFIECDSLNIFWLSGLSDDYICSKKDTRAIEFIRQRFPRVDILILGTPDGIGPEKGNGIREAYLESRGLSPKAVFFMGKGPLERRILYQVRHRIPTVQHIQCSQYPGDAFFLSEKGIVR